MKRVFMLAGVLVFGFILSSCQLLEKPKTFAGNGVTITLNTSFVEKQSSDFPLYLVSRDNGFATVRQAKSDMSSYGITSLDGYFQEVLTEGKHTTETIQKYDEDGVSYDYVYYTATANNQEYGYMVISMESKDYYYLINFWCLEKNFDKYKDQYIDWAKTIKVE